MLLFLLKVTKKIKYYKIFNFSINLQKWLQLFFPFKSLSPAKSNFLFCRIISKFTFKSICIFKLISKVFFLGNVVKSNYEKYA